MLMCCFHLQVYVIGSSLERIGKQIAFELCCWTFIENNGGNLVYSFLLLFFLFNVKLEVCEGE